MSDPDESEVIAQERAASAEASRDGHHDYRYVGGSWHHETTIPTGDEIE